jgi:hypothetical protein
VDIRKFQVVIRGDNGHELDRGDIITIDQDIPDYNEHCEIRIALNHIMMEHIYRIGDSITIE